MNERPLDYFRAKTVAAALAGTGVVAVFAIIAVDRKSVYLTIAGFAFAVSIPVLSAFALACETRSQRQRAEVGLFLPGLGVVGLLAAATGIASLFLFLSPCIGVTFILSVVTSSIIYLRT